MGRQLCIQCSQLFGVLEWCWRLPSTGVSPRDHVLRSSNTFSGRPFPSSPHLYATAWTTLPIGAAPRSHPNERQISDDPSSCTSNLWAFYHKFLITITGGVWHPKSSHMSCVWWWVQEFQGTNPREKYEMVFHLKEANVRCTVHAHDLKFQTSRNFTKSISYVYFRDGVIKKSKW